MLTAGDAQNGGYARRLDKDFFYVQEENYFFVQPRNAAETGYPEHNFPLPNGLRVAIPQEIVQFLNIIALFLLFSTS